MRVYRADKLGLVSCVPVCSQDAQSFDAIHYRRGVELASRCVCSCFFFFFHGAPTNVERR